MTDTGEPMESAIVSGYDSDDDEAPSTEVAISVPSPSERGGEKDDDEGEEEDDARREQYEPQQPADIRSSLVALISNPEQMSQALNVTDEQIDEMRTLVVSFGTGAAHKFLGKHIGEVPASLLGSALSSLLAKKMIRRE